jgi:hypothetical protein
MKKYSVYCIREQRLSKNEPIHYKIGCAERPHIRRRQLQPGNPHKLRPVFYIEGFKSKREAEKAEQSLHALFNEFRTRDECEWFSVNPIIFRRFQKWLSRSTGVKLVVFGKGILDRTQVPLTEPTPQTAPQQRSIAGRSITGQRAIIIRSKRRRRVPKQKNLMLRR